jgi:hypothetical protein
MKVIYFLQTHTNPEQIFRLVNTIKKSSLNSHILIIHDFTSVNLDEKPLRSMSEVEIIPMKREAHVIRGSFAENQAYLDAIEWVFDKNINFDWFVNLSGQDYPTQSLAQFENFLDETKFDGFLEHRDILSKNSYYGKYGRDHYLYQYWHSSVQLSKWQRGLLKPLRLLINNTQPLVRVDSSYQFSIGVRAIPKLFNSKFICYGGSYFKILSRNCIEYLYETAKKRADLIAYYRKTILSAESFTPTVLVNSGLFNICDQNKFYIDWTGTKHGRPNILTVADYSKIVEKKDIYFARKFDVKKDSRILDMLDDRIHSNGSPN